MTFPVSGPEPHFPARNPSNPRTNFSLVYVRMEEGRNPPENPAGPLGNMDSAMKFDAAIRA
jgi:hypothetical protein